MHLLYLALPVLSTLTPSLLILDYLFENAKAEIKIIKVLVKAMKLSKVRRRAAQHLNTTRTTGKSRYPRVWSSRPATVASRK